MHIYGRKIFKDHSTQRLKQLKVLDVCPCTYNITTSNLNISIAFPPTINKSQFYKMSIMWYIFSSSCFIKYSFIYLKSRTTLKKRRDKKRGRSLLPDDPPPVYLPASLISFLRAHNFHNSFSIFPASQSNAH